MTQQTNGNGNEDSDISFTIEVMKGFSLIFFAKMVGQVILFVVTNILLINWMSEESNIDYVIFQNYVNLIFVLVLSLHVAMPKLLQKDSIESRKSYLINGLVLMVINFLIIIIGFLILTLSFNFEYNVSQSNLEFLGVFLFGGLAYVIFRLFESVLYGLKLSTKVAFINLLLSIVLFLLAWSLVAVFKLGFIGVVLGFLISYFLLDGFSLYFIFREIGRELNLNGESESGSLKSNLNKETLKELIIFCLPLFIANIFYFLNTRFNTLLLSGLGNSTPVIFDISLTLTIYLIGLLGITINDLLLPHESHAFIHDNQEKIKEIFKLIFTFVVLTIIPLLFVCIFIGSFILGFLYPEYYPLYPIFLTIFQLILIGGFFYSLNQFTARFLVAKGSTIPYLVIQVIGGVMNVMIVVIFIQFFGVYSAIWGFILSMATMFVLYFYSISKIIDLSIWEFKLIQLVGAILVVFCEFFILKLVFSLEDILIGVICVPSYLLLLLGFRILSIQDLKKFFNNIKLIVSKVRKA